MLILFLSNCTKVSEKYTPIVSDISYKIVEANSFFSNVNKPYVLTCFTDEVYGMPVFHIEYSKRKINSNISVSFKRIKEDWRNGAACVTSPAFTYIPLNLESDKTYQFTFKLNGEKSEHEASIGDSIKYSLITEGNVYLEE